jgi:hypothetical protein
MSYLAMYDFCEKKKEPESWHNHESSVCFSRLFGLINYEKNFRINKFKLFALSEKYGDYDNFISFTNEEMNLYFEKVSNIFDPPEITLLSTEESNKIYNTNAKIYQFLFDFNNKTPMYIKGILTYTRYLYEKETRANLIRDAFKWSNLLPDIPFIEIFQILHMHEDLESISGHSLVQSNHYVKNVQIISEKEISQSVKNLRLTETRIQNIFGLYWTQKDIFYKYGVDLLGFPEITEKLIIETKRKRYEDIY